MNAILKTRRLIFAVSLIAACMLAAAEQSGETLVWNKDNQFDGWKQLRNVKCEIKEGVLRLTEIQKDCQLISGPLNLDPSPYIGFSFKYRYENSELEKATKGELYFAHANSPFTDRAKWVIPTLNADGQWHTITLTSKDLNNKVSWFEGGTITSLRLDPTGSAGGLIEISEIRLIAAQQKPVWDKTNGFEDWHPNKDIKSEVKDGLLVLSDIMKNPQLASGALQIAPAEMNVFSFRYRVAKAVEGRKWGHLFYAHKGERFIDKNRWNIPPLNADGKWHTMTLTEKNINNKEGWFNEGDITNLRFDPPAHEGTILEISEIKLSNAAEEVKNTPVQKKNNERPLPPMEYSLDAPEWPSVKPQFLDSVNPPPKNEKYFQCKMIKSKHDVRIGAKHNSFYLRCEIELREQPVQAWIQYVADDSADAFINGELVCRNNNWRITASAEVSQALKAGKNVWGFYYKNNRSAGGVFGELYVQYADGSFERFNTDGSFRSSVQSEKNWNRTDFDASKWEPVIEQNGPPNIPWIVKVAYSDYSAPQQFLKGTISTKTARADSTVKFRFDFKGKALSTPMEMTLRLIKNNSNAWSEALVFDKNNIVTDNNGLWHIEFDYKMPRYLNSGRMIARIESGSLFCKKGGFPQVEFDFMRLNHDEKFSKKPETRIENSKEYGPYILLNGKPAYFEWASVNASRRPDRRPRFGDAPINLMTLGCNVSEIWTSCGEFNPIGFDRQAEAYHREHPDVWFMWDLSIYPPADWAEKYPDEMCRNEKGKVNKEGGRVNHSFASKKALADMEDYLVKAINYLESSPYANRIIGYRVNGGHTIEWLGWDSDNPKLALDFSPAAKKGFEAFAKQHYPQLKDYSIPTFLERNQLDNGELLWEPAKHLNAIAYHDFYSNAVADMLIHLCSKAKSLLNNKKLVGTYYGYVSTLHGSGWSQMRAHYALKKVLDSKAVDFLMSPQAYSIRNLGDTCGDMKPFASIRNAGIIPVIEDDTRTHNGIDLVANNDYSQYQTLTEEATLAVMRRNMGIALCRNEIPYYYGLALGTGFDFPAMVNECGKIRRAGEFCLQRKTRRNARIAVVFSEKTVTSMPMLYSGPMERSGMYQYYRNNGKAITGIYNAKVLVHESFIGNATRFSRLGAPVDYILAEDMKDNPGDYQLYIFLNCFAYDRDFLKTVEKLRQRECVMFWVYAPGYTFEGTNSIENMKALTGISMEKSAEPLVPAVKLNNGKWMGGRSTRIAPNFYVNDANAEVLGTNELGKAGMAAVRIGKALSIFSCAYQLDVPFLTDLAKRAGVHIYSENSDPMEANEALFSLHARFPGKKTIKLPHKADVLDIFNGKIIARDTDCFDFDAPLHSSWLFYYGNDADELLKKLGELY